MKVALGADHAGFQLKNEILEVLREAGHQVEDFGCSGPDSVDYPDYAEQVGRAVSEGRFDRGILVCGTGIGMCISANKFAMLRAST